MTDGGENRHPEHEGGGGSEPMVGRVEARSREDHGESRSGRGGPRSLSAPALAEAGKAIALAVVLSLVVSYAPIASALVIPLVPLPLAYLSMRQGLGAGLGAVVGTGALTAAFAGPANGILALLLAGLVGVVMGMALRRRSGFSLTLLSTAAGAAVALASWAGLVWIIAGLSRSQLGDLVDKSLQSATKVYQSMGMSQASIDLAMNQVRASIAVLPYLLPCIVALMALFLACITVALAAKLFPRMGDTLTSALSFAHFRLHWSVPYGLIGGLGLLVVGRYLEQGVTLARFAGWNLVAVFVGLFFLQGLAVVHSFVKERKLGTGTRVAIYGGVVVSQLVLLLPTCIGLLDTWFDYRKRFSPAPGASATASRKAPPARPDENDEEET